MTYCQPTSAFLRPPTSDPRIRKLNNHRPLELQCPCRLSVLYLYFELQLRDWIKQTGTVSHWCGWAKICMRTATFVGMTNSNPRQLVASGLRAETVGNYDQDPEISGALSWCINGRKLAFVLRTL